MYGTGDSRWNCNFLWWIRRRPSIPNKGNDGLAGDGQNPACEVITQKSPEIHDKLVSNSRSKRELRFYRCRVTMREEEKERLIETNLRTNLRTYLEINY